MDVRSELLESSLEQVFAAYDEALTEKIKSPVVFLLDCGDKIGGKVAREWVGEDAVEDALAENRRAGGDVLTTLAQCLSFTAARRDVPEMFPYLAGTFAEMPPAGTFVAVVVAAGGAGTFFVPPDARLA